MYTIGIQTYNGGSNDSGYDFDCERVYTTEDEALKGLKDVIQDSGESPEDITLFYGYIQEFTHEIKLKR